jgi:hypothetical protein
VVSRRISVQVLRPDYRGVIGPITPDDLLSASCTWQWQGVGTASMTVREASEAAAQLMLIRDYVVPVTMKAPGYPRWTGHVVNTQRKKTAGLVGRITATMVDERDWYRRILAAPVPTSPWSDQSAASHDRRTGPLVTVVRQYVAANVARLAAAGQDIPLVLLPPPLTDDSPEVTIDARNETIAEEIKATLLTHGYDLTANLWLPGDEPAGDTPQFVTMNTATILVDVVAGRTRPWVNFSDERGGVAESDITVSSPGATSVVVGGPGEDTARLFDYVIADDGRLTTLGPFGRSEVFLDATDAETSALRIERGREKLTELSGKVGINLTINDERPWKAGPAADYWVGDEVRATFSGVEFTDRISRISVSSTTDGFEVNPQFGSTDVAETADVRLARKVADLAAEVARLRARP